MKVSKACWVALAVGVLAFGARLVGLGSFMTVDEENWMLRSAGFYHNIFRNQDTGGAFMTTHPGATAMWIAGAGIVLQEARLGFDIDTSNLMYFRIAATLPIATAVSVLIGFAALLLVRLFGVPAGAAAGILLALEPYLVGMSQVAHLDMLLALLMLNSVLAFLLHSRSVTESYSPGVAKWGLHSSTSFTPGEESSSTPGVFPVRLLVLSGIFAGLALGTKLLPALWLFAFFAAFLVWHYRWRVSKIIRHLGFIFGVAALVFYVAWPALWFTADLGRSFGKDVPSIVQDAHVEIEESDQPIAPVSFYGRVLLARTTPFVLILSVAAVFAVIYPFSALLLGKRERKRGSGVAWLFVYAIGFLLMITLAAKKADRYALPALSVLPVIAGWGLGRLPTLHLRGVKWGTAFVGILLLAQVLLLSPHAIAYNNPFFDVRPLSQQGWGEGLEEAAAWLDAQPRAEELYVASWYPGVVRTFFKGKTLSLSSRDDDRVGFVVLYRNMLGRALSDSATAIVEEFHGTELAYVVAIQGVSYAWVYDTRGLYYFPQHVGELYGRQSVGQLVPIRTNDWSAIEIGMATFSSRKNTQDVILHVRENVEAMTDLRTVRVNARDVQDSSYHRFEFEPIADSAGKTYYVFLDSPTSQPGDAVTVRFANQDLLPGEMVKNGKILSGRDGAWRIPR